VSPFKENIAWGLGFGCHMSSIVSILNKLALIAAITLEIDTIGDSDEQACQRADYRNAGIWYVSPTMQRVDAVCNGATEE
jgi:hypothetical protein